MSNVHKEFGAEMAQPGLKLAQFHPRADELRQATMSVINEFKQSIQESSTGLTLTELLVQHPQVARRTAQDRPDDCGQAHQRKR